MFVYFDLDRTLLDFESAADVGIKTIYDLYKSELKMEYEEFSFNWKKWAQIFFDRYSEGIYTFDEQRKMRVKKSFELNGVLLSEEENNKRFNIYWSAYEKQIRLFPDVIPVLESLKKHKVPMGIITNGDSQNQNWKLNSKNLSSYFDPIIISGEVGVSKPDLKIFKTAVQRVMEKIPEASENPSDFWYIGDSVNHDIEPSVKMGWNTVFINRTEKKYDIPSCVIEVDDMRKILPKILADS